MFIWIFAVLVMLYNFFEAYYADKAGEKELYIIYRFFLAAPADYIEYIVACFRSFGK